jgi:hypothetical protein
MFGGVSVFNSYEITEGQFVRQRIRMNGSTPEMFFLLGDPDQVLPVSRGGRTEVLQWGARQHQSGNLPATAWVRQEDLDAGKLAALEPEHVVIRANRAVDNGVWYDVNAGILAVVVADEMGRPVVYPLVETASRYYQKLTGSEWMPCLVRQRL